jgi:hypothetical protein
MAVPYAVHFTACGARTRDDVMTIANAGNSAIEPVTVRYIKLGEGGKWERECIDRGIIRLGFGSAEPTTFEQCVAGKWDELKAAWLRDGYGESTSSRFTNETRTFFRADSSLLWITFVGERLYWGFMDDSAAVPHDDGDGTWRRIAGGWKCEDINGEKLTKDKLSGALTQLSSYRGTSCGVSVSEYAIRRINGRKIPEVEHAFSVLQEMQVAAASLVRLLTWRDLELLVDLVFSASGWRRLGAVGKTQKTLDLDIMLPSTDERAFVQVKARASQAELEHYVRQFGELQIYDRMFFVHHTGSLITDDPNVTVIGCEKLAAMVIEAGLTNWLLQKVS